MASPTSSWRSCSRSSSTVTKPCSMASSRPAVMSASSTPSPRRGADDERGGALGRSRSKAVATAARVWRSSGRPAAARSRVTRRHSGERTARRASTRSPKSAARDTVGSSRRAASSSSATSGRPPERSTTTTSTLAEGRSPSIDSMSRASSSWPSGPRVSLAGGRTEAWSVRRSCAQGSSRRMASAWYVPTMARRWSRAMRARKATRVRVPASARCRSSTASSTGRRWESRPTTPRMPSSSRA